MATKKKIERVECHKYRGEFRDEFPENDMQKILWHIKVIELNIKIEKDGGDFLSRPVHRSPKRQKFLGSLGATDLKIQKMLCYASWYFWRETEENIQRAIVEVLKRERICQ